MAPIPRLRAYDGPALLSYGFRPLFLLAALQARPQHPQRYRLGHHQRGQHPHRDRPTHAYAALSSGILNR